MFSQIKFVKTNGPFETNPLSALDVVIDSRDIVYVTTIEGVYISTNDGRNWIHSEMEEDNSRKVSVNSKGVVLVASSNLLCLSKDSGRSWTKIKQNIPPLLSVMINSNNHIFLGTQEGLYYSFDEGKSLKKFGFGKNPVNSIVINSNDEIYISTDNGVYYSRDHEMNFIDLNLEAKDIKLLAINAKEQIFAVSGNSIYRTTNNGKRWENISPNYLHSDYVSGEELSICSITIDLRGVIYLGLRSWCEGYCYAQMSSNDNGNNWSESKSYVGGYTVHNSKGYIFSICDNYVVTLLYSSSDNGKTWSICSDGLRSSSIYSLAISPEGELFSISNDVLSWSKNKGNKWNSSKLEDPAYYSKEIFINSKNDLYVFDYIAGEGIFSNFKIMLSKDNGKTWRTITENSEIDLCAMGVDSRDNLYLIQRGKGKIIKSTDNGENWTYFCDVDKSEYYYAIHFNLYDDIFVQTDDLLLRSTDKGVSWRNINHNVKFNGIFVTQSGAIFALGTNNEYEQSLYISNDNGNNWKKIHRFDSNLGIRNIVLDEDGYLYFGTEGNGVWRSTKPFQF